MMRYQDVLSNTRLLILFVAFLVVSGLSAYSSLPRAEDPSIVNRSAVIATLYPGAAATRVESLVTEVIEDKLREVSEINDMSSVSRLGVSVINIRLHEEAPNAELIWSDVRDKLADVEPYLPSGALTPDLDHDGGPAFTAIYSLGWQGPQKPDLLLLGRYAKELAKRLRNMSGTELVDEYGSQDEEILVNIHTEDALTTGYSTEQLAVAIEKADVKNSAGELTNNATRFGLELANPLDSIERIKQIPVSVDQNGYAIRVEDIAAVNRVAKTPADELAMLNGMPAVFVAARMLPSLRVDHWTPQVDKLLEEFSNELPSSIKISTVFSQRPYTEKRIFELGESLLIGLGLVLFVLLFTLGIRSACVIALALPLTLLFTLTLMKYFMVPIDQMSLTGFIVALGIMVDNAVVMVDTIRSYRMQNKSPLESAMLAVRHLWIPLASSTLTTVLAFAPVFLMPGSVGEFVSPVALTVVFSLLGSYIISHTVIAALAGVFVPDSSSALPWYQRGIQITFISRWFSRSIATAIRRPYLAVAIVSSLPILGFWSVSQLTEQFFPPADRDMFEMRVYLPPQASINATKDTTDQVNQLIMEEDGVEMIGWSIGTAFPSFYYNMAPPEHNAPFFAQAMVKVNSIETANQLIPKLQAKLDRAIPQAQIIVRKLEQGPPFNAPVELRVYGNDVEVLKEIGKDIRLILSQITDVTHTRQSLPPGIPQFELNIDEQAIKMNAMNLSDFANLL